MEPVSALVGFLVGVLLASTVCEYTHRQDAELLRLLTEPEEAED